MSQTTKPETLIVFHTTMGDITAKLYNDTPLHRDNFIKLINEGWYDDSPFHRIICWVNGPWCFLVLLIVPMFVRRPWRH